MATPGFFGLTLQSGVKAAIYDYCGTYFAVRIYLPGYSVICERYWQLLLISMDLTDLSSSRQDYASISIHPDTGRMMENGRFLPSFWRETTLLTSTLTSAALLHTIRARQEVLSPSP